MMQVRTAGLRSCPECSYGFPPMEKTVAEVMTRNVVTVHPETPIDEAIRLLASDRIGGLPVVGQAGALVGIISQGDLMWRETGVTPPAYIMILDSVIYLENPAQYQQDLHKALGQTVGEVMSTKTITITEDKPLPAAARLMHDHNIQQLPVLDLKGNLVGMITRGDIVRDMAASQPAP